MSSVNDILRAIIIICPVILFKNNKATLQP